MDNSNVSKIVIGFFMIIVGLALIGAIANNGDAVVSQKVVINETFDISDARNLTGTTFALNYSVDITIASANIPSGWKTTECVLSGFSLVNQSGTALTDTTDYDVAESTGIVNFYNTLNANMSGTSNTTYVSYTYCPDGYLTIAWGRSIINLVAGFFALAILGLGLGLFYSVAKDSGILGS